jgi:5-methylcytosine-specific restriction enzyme subunit McrC
MKLQQMTRSSENDKEIRQLLLPFELVDISANIDKDFSSVSLGRDTKDYEKLIAWSDVFLRNKSFTTFSGSKIGSALLFPMEQVFEAFIAKWVKRIFTEESDGAYRVSVQDRGYYLFDNPQKFRLRPDIVVRKNGEPILIIDTKWKRLKPDPNMNYGISQADMYQMYAYSKKYHTSDIWLLYPLNEDVAEVGDISFIAEQDEDIKINLKIFFINLAEHEKSILTLYKELEDNYRAAKTVQDSY